MASNLSYFGIYTACGEFLVDKFGWWTWGAVDLRIAKFCNPKMPPLVIAVCNEAVEVNFLEDGDCKNGNSSSH